MTKTAKSKSCHQESKVDVAPQPIPQRKRLYDEPGPNNTIILDLGGDGDCGYRSIAAAMALRSAKDLREVRENIVSLGKTIQQRFTSISVTTTPWAIDPTANEAM